MTMQAQPGERDVPRPDPGAAAANPAAPAFDGPPPFDPGEMDIGRSEATALLEQLTAFDGPPEQFLEFLLHAQCDLTGAFAGAVLRQNEHGVVQVVACTAGCIAGGQPEAWLKQVGESLQGKHGPVAVGSRTLPVRRGDELYGARPDRFVTVIPIRRPGGMRGAAAYLFGGQDDATLAQTRRELELTLSLLGQYELRLTVQRRQADLRLAKTAMEVAASVQQHDRFKKAAMAFCNEIASRWKATRVSLGFLHGRHVKLAATSSSENFSRKMRLIQDLEAAQEECLDQAIEILLPCPPETPIINRQHGHLSTHHGPCGAVSMPLRRLGEVEGVLTVEIDPQRSFTAADLEGLRILCDLAAPFLFEVRLRDRWIGPKIADATRDFAKILVGPRYTWAKLTAIGVALFVAFVTLYPAPHRVDAPFTVVSARRQVVAAPFDGYLADVKVSVGEELPQPGVLLAELETAELKLQYAATKAELMRYDKEADLSRREGKTADAQIAEAEADKLQAQLDLLAYQLEQAKIVSPIEGVVAEGDLKRRIGSAVSRGDTLFEIVRVSDLEVELAVGEDRIGDVIDLLEKERSPRGLLSAASHPGDYIGFTVTRVEPVAEVADARNIFKVRAKLDEVPTFLRPGVEGLAKIDAGTASYAYLWTRDAVNWVRMQLWL